MPVFVSKFGGTSLSTGERFLNVLNIVRENPDRRFIVVSAPGKRFKRDDKITDLLLECSKNQNRSDFDEIRHRFLRISECAGVSVKDELDECEEKIFSGASEAYAASRGEYLSAKIFSMMGGFHFLDADNAAQSVLVFSRADRRGREVLVVLNFTPVLRDNFRVGVLHPGVYREIFNSDLADFGGEGNCNTGVLRSEKIPWHAQAHSLTLTLPPLGAVMLKCEKRRGARVGRYAKKTKRETEGK